MATTVPALTYEEIATARSAIRVIRYLAVLTVAIAVPVAVALLTPLVGWALLAALILSPLILLYVVVVAARQAERERRLASR